MLIEETKTGTSAKVIAVSGTSPNVLYTVPAGKTFVGYLIGPLIVNGAYFATGPAGQVELVSGTILAGGSTSTIANVLGVER